MLPDRVSNPGPLTYESGALPIALRGPALNSLYTGRLFHCYILDESIYSLYTGRLFHCYILDESICQFRGVRSFLSLLFNLWHLIWVCTICL